MTFNLLPLQDFAATDTAYIDYMNTNNSNLTTMLTGARADLVGLAGSTGTSVADDWRKRIDSTDPVGGALGPYSFVCQVNTPTIALTHGNSDGNSYAYIGATRYNTSAVLTHTVTSTDVGDGFTQTRWLGINVDTGTLAISINLTSNPATQDLTLYSLSINNTSNVFTISKIKRYPRSLLMSNTLEQLRQETPESLWMSTAGNTNSSTTPRNHWEFVVPVDHTWGGSPLYAHLGSNVANWFGTIDIQFVAETGPYAASTVVVQANLLTGGVSVPVTGITTNDLIGIAFPAGTRYKVVTTKDGGASAVSGSSLTVTASYFKSYNVPTA